MDRQRYFENVSNLSENDIQRLQQKNVALEAESAKIKEENTKLLKDLEKYRESEKFTQERGALWRINPDGTYSESPCCVRFTNWTLSTLKTYFFMLLATEIHFISFPAAPQISKAAQIVYNVSQSAKLMHGIHYNGLPPIL